MRYKLLNILLLCLIIFPVAVSSSENKEDESEHKKWALEFRFTDDLFDLDFKGHTGLTGSIAHYYSGRRAWRLGATVSSTQRSLRQGRYRYVPVSVDVRLHKLFFADERHQGQVRGYWGCGPTFGVIYLDDDDALEDRSDATARVFYRELSFGLDLVAGVAWYPFNWLSLSGEYWLTVGYTNRTSEVYEDRFFWPTLISTETTNVLEINDIGAVIHLSVFVL